MFFHVGRQTVMMKRIVAFRNFANASKIVIINYYKTINFVFMKVLHVST
jgi:hypothetical protein